MTLVSAGVDSLLFGGFGLLIGSFLNVVIHRLPRMLEAEWAATCAELAGTEPAMSKPFNLLQPRSRCPSCQRPIRWHENIPVLSYLALRAKCAGCGVSISARYPIIELATGALFVAVATHHGVTLAAVLWAVFAALLVAQFFIDFDTQLLPDDLNYLILWLGLIAAAAGWTKVPPHAAVWGAVFGYLSLWSVYQVHHQLTGKQGMGHGDFKLLAGLGAWFGSDHLVALILLSSVVGSVIGLILIIAGRIRHKDIPIPFGPFLAGAGLLAMVLGPRQLQALVPFAFPFSQLAR